MCKVCDERLLNGAHAALMLSQAAKNLYDINQSAEAEVLAKASAELFKPVEELVTGEVGETQANKNSVGTNPSVRSRLQTPRGEVVLYNDGTATLNGKPIALVLV